MEPIVKFENVSKIYDSATKVLALNGIDLDIGRGERIAVMGPSGSGKSTLLNLISGLDQPSSGKIYIEGKALSDLSDDQRTRLRREKVGLIFQTFNLLPTLSAIENVSLPLRLGRVSHTEAQTKAAELLGKVGLRERIDHRPDELSGGERQRTAIARALIFNPPVLLADEPTGNLDSHTGAEIMELLDELHSEYQTTIILVTHNELAAAHCERRITLLDGRVCGGSS